MVNVHSFPPALKTLFSSKWEDATCKTSCENELLVVGITSFVYLPEAMNNMTEHVSVKC